MTIFKRVFKDTVNISVHRVGDRCMNVYAAKMERCWQGKHEALSEKSVPFKFCTQQKPTRNGLGFKRVLRGKRQVAKFLTRIEHPNNICIRLEVTKCFVVFLLLLFLQNFFRQVLRGNFTAVSDK